MFPVLWTRLILIFMKSQDVLLLFKLISLNGRHTGKLASVEFDKTLYGWEPDEDETKVLINHNDAILKAAEDFEYFFTNRGLSEQLEISKSEINNSIERCINVHLMKINRISGKPEVNIKALSEFINHGLKYVFPVKPAEITRGIPTTFAAPVLKEKLHSAGNIKMVWPDHRGKEMGQSIKPLYKTVPMAVKKDPTLYSYLALVDAIRMGNARESNLAREILNERMQK